MPVGELTIPLNAESQRKSHFLFFLISKLWGGFLIPFLYLLFLSHSLSLLSSNTLFLPLSPFNIHRVLMPPAAGCGLLAGCKNHVSLVADLSHSWSFQPLCRLCYFFLLSLHFSPMLSKWLSLFPHHLSVPLVSYYPHLCFSVFLPTHFLNFTFWLCSLCLNLYPISYFWIPGFLSFGLFHRLSFCCTPSPTHWWNVFFHRETHQMFSWLS